MSGAIEMSRSCVEDTTVVHECVSAGQSYQNMDQLTAVR